MTSSSGGGNFFFLVLFPSWLDRADPVGEGEGGAEVRILILRGWSWGWAGGGEGARMGGATGRGGVGGMSAMDWKAEGWTVRTSWAGP